MVTETQTDLSALTVDRSVSQAGTPRSRPRDWLSRYVVPGGILLGFALLIGISAGRQFLPATSVRVVPVIVRQAAVQPEGTALFQAAGWIEPRPTQINVPALTAGVIEELLVVEGQQVSRDEPVARLITEDAELAVQQAEAALAIREAELQKAKAERQAAEIRLNNPVHLEAELADAQSLVARAETELNKLPHLIDAAEARLQYTRDNVAGKRAASEAIAGRILQQAESQYAEAQATITELRQREPNLRRELQALQSKVQALQQQRDLLVDEHRQLDVAIAGVAAATALRDEARLQLRQAELNLQRTVIRAPVAGRILRLTTSPGTRVMGLEANAGESSGTVVEMYDPTRLQVRADVRLEDVPQVHPGQPVEIETASAGNVIQGRVLQVTSSADVQKNTLEVKVELLQPPPTVRPEMLVTATFLAPQQEVDDGPAAGQAQRMFVPRQLVLADDSQPAVWVVDEQDRAVRKSVAVGSPGPEGLVEIVSGLQITDKLIASETAELEAGQRVEISGEDRVLGVESE